MKIEKNLNGKELIVVLEGRLDTISAPTLEAEMKSSINDIDSLIFDFKGIEYISSAGLRVLLMAQKEMNKQGDLKVINVNDDIMEIFEVTGFSDILTIE